MKRKKERKIADPSGGPADDFIPDMNAYITSLLSALEGKGEGVEWVRAEKVKDELISMQDAYIKFLDSESTPFIQFAAVHGMEVSKDVFEKGKSFRTLISLLKSKLTTTPPATPPTGMRWVLACDRLPENDGKYVVKMHVGSANPRIVVMESEFTKGGGNVRDHWRGAVDWDFVSEWLDETPPTAIQTDAEEGK